MRRIVLVWLIAMAALLAAFVLLTTESTADRGSSPQPAAAPASTHSEAFLPGMRVLLDAHNCYPYEDRWTDRIDRALGTGVPVAIEQDLYWYRDPATGSARSIVSHGEPFTGREPGLRTHFFERIRPIVERALASGDRAGWPLITLNLDFKTDEPEHHAAVWQTLQEYASWISTAERTADPSRVMPIDVKPVLVLTGSADAQQASFHDRVPIGGRLLLFGATKASVLNARTKEDEQAIEDGRLLPELHPAPATNYRRWWNNPWRVVELGGQRKAGPWGEADEARLQALVRLGHERGLWVRFYTLNGHAPGQSLGWFEDYNFGSLEAAEARWRAAVRAGVDFVATDQYEAFAAVLQKIMQDRD